MQCRRIGEVEVFRCTAPHLALVAMYSVRLRVESPLIGRCTKAVPAERLLCFVYFLHFKMAPRSCAECKRRRIACVELTTEGCATCLRRKVQCSGPPKKEDYQKHSRVAKGAKMAEVRWVSILKLLSYIPKFTNLAGKPSAARSPRWTSRRSIRLPHACSRSSYKLHCITTSSNQLDWLVATRHPAHGWIHWLISSRPPTFVDTRFNWSSAPTQLHPKAAYRLLLSTV